MSNTPVKRGAKPARTITRVDRASCSVEGHDCKVVFQVDYHKTVCAAFLRANEIKPAFDKLHGEGSFDRLRGDAPLSQARQSAKDWMVRGDGMTPEPADSAAVPVPDTTGDGTDQRTVRDGVVDAAEYAEKVRQTEPPMTIDGMIDSRIEEAVASGKAGVDRQQVAEIVSEFADTLSPKVTRYEYRDRPAVELPDGTSHAAVPKVLHLINAGFQPWLVGPAGTGKSTIAKQVAEVMSLGFMAVSCSPMTDVTELTGFVDANSIVRDTPYRDSYVNGGVALVDEMDQANPGMVKGCNALFEGETAMFAGGMETRHADHHPIVATNTYGLGGDREYNGNVLDASTRNRFRMVTVDYDHKLETAVARANAPTTELADLWRDLLWQMRKNQTDHGVKAIISTRNMADCRLLVEGSPFTVNDVLEMGIFQGMDSSQSGKLLADCASQVDVIQAKI